MNLRVLKEEEKLPLKMGQVVVVVKSDPRELQSLAM